MKALDTQPDLPFPTDPTFPITVGLDENGEYIMEYPSILEIMLTDEQKALFEEIRKKHKLPPLARYSVQAYMKKIFLLILMAIVFLPSIIQAQTIIIADGTATNGNLPIYGYMADCNQQIEFSPIYFLEFIIAIINKTIINFVC